MRVSSEYWQISFDLPLSMNWWCAPSSMRLHSWYCCFSPSSMSWWRTFIHESVHLILCSYLHPWVGNDFPQRNYVGITFIYERVVWFHPWVFTSESFLFTFIYESVTYLHRWVDTVVSFVIFIHELITCCSSNLFAPRCESFCFPHQNRKFTPQLSCSALYRIHLSPQWSQLFLSSPAESVFCASSRVVISIPGRVDLISSADNPSWWNYHALPSVGHLQQGFVSSFPCVSHAYH